MKPIHQNCPIAAHPLANTLPMLKGEDAKAFQATIAEQGIHTPVVIIQTGTPTGHNRNHDGEPQVLGGRNRIKFGLEQGISWADIPKRDYSLATDGTPEEFILREDINGRRHLTPDQRAQFAAKSLEATTEAIRIEREAAAKAEAEKNPAAEPQPGDSAEADPKKKAKAEKQERPSHEARKKVAKEAGVSEDAVKKALAYGKYDDLVEAVNDGKLSADAAAKQASERKAAASAKKHEERLRDERKAALTYLKSTFGEDSIFTKSVVSKKIFGDEKRGHKDLALFIELKLSEQQAIIPLLVDGLTLKESFTTTETAVDETTTILDAINHHVANGLGTKKQTVAFAIGDYTITIDVSPAEAKRIKGLITKK